MSEAVIGFAIGILSTFAASGLVALRRKWQMRLRFRAVLGQLTQLTKRITEDGFNPEYLVAIDRSSGVIASIMAAHFLLLPPVTVGTVNTRRQDGTRETRIDPVFEGSLQRLSGKKLLVVICCNDSGTSLGHVTRYLSTMPTPPAEIRTAALFTTVSPAVRPQYSAIVLGRNTRMSMDRILRSLPWVTPEWRLALAEERHGATASR